MDLKNKGKTWVGNICNRFESMCNEVDGFINKETVKYVENQVQSVGSGVKRFYTNVVQEMLPPLEDIVNSEEWSMQQGSVDTQRNNNTLMPSKLNCSVQCFTAPVADPCEEAETDLPLEQSGDGIISKDSDNVVRETRDTSGVRNNTTLSMVSSLAPPVHEASLVTLPKGGISGKSFSDAVECSSDVSSTGWEFNLELDLPEIEDSNSDDDRSLSAPQDVSVDKGQEDNVPVMDSSSSSADDADCRTPEKEKLTSDNLSTEVVCFNASSPVLPTALELPEVEDSNFDEDAKLSVPKPVSIDNGQKGNVKIMNSSSSSSADDADCRTSEKDRPPDDNLSTEVVCFNESSTIQQHDLPEVESSNFDEDGSLSVPQAVSVDKGEIYNLPAKNLSTSSADDADCRTSDKDGTLSDNFSTVDECFNASSTIQSPEIVVSNFSCENEEADNGVFCSGCSASPESSNFSELTLAELVQKAEDIFGPRVDSIDCIYDKSNDHKCSASFTTAACETKTPDFIPAFSDVNTSITHGSVSVFEPSGSRKELCCDSHQSNLLMSPTEIGNFCEVSGGISDPNMATVDLSDKVERDGSCAIVNANSVYSAAYRGRNFRYYKKLIKNAFGSHKRLIKEYEHLAILYGDVDKELWQHSGSSSLPSTPTAYSLLPRSPSQETPEPDWELL
ncbi:Hypothetical predicted protein [Olea europaea subsp. europaea]|uniref:Uncharacterized protein n=2 Tax=Olea europaea subsp. europaea TaxID=158383 RepID=A0A8S0THY4_OLEEU|nr:Hypothetical predicted protein [Olea europaea subsp. europaea]